MKATVNPFITAQDLTGFQNLLGLAIDLPRLWGLEGLFIWKFKRNIILAA